MIQFVSQLSPSRENACCQRADWDVIADQR